MKFGRVRFRVKSLVTLQSKAAEEKPMETGFMQKLKLGNKLSKVHSITPSELNSTGFLRESARSINDYD